jgi:hypothetical protein
MRTGKEHAKKHAKNMHNKNALGMNEHETGMNANWYSFMPKNMPKTCIIRINLA